MFVLKKVNEGILIEVSVQISPRIIFDVELFRRISQFLPASMMEVLKSIGSARSYVRVDARIVFHVKFGQGANSVAGPTAEIVGQRVLVVREVIVVAIPSAIEKQTDRTPLLPPLNEIMVKGLHARVSYVDVLLQIKDWVKIEIWPSSLARWARQIVFDGIDVRGKYDAVGGVVKVPIEQSR